MFNPKYYLENNPDVARDPYYGSRPLDHYNNHGRAEGRNPYAPPMSAPLPPLATVAPPMSAPNPPSVSGWATATGPSNQRFNIQGLMKTTSSAPPVSSSLPPLSMPSAPTLPGIDGNKFIAQPTGPANSGDVGQIINKLMAQFQAQGIPASSEVVQSAVNDILNRSNPYIDRARARATDFAGQRGLLNSSIAAGAAEGAAIDAAMPLIQESLGITNRREAEDFARRQAGFGAASGLLSQREQQNFQGQQAQLDRVQGVNNALLANQISERQAQLADYYSRGQMVLDGQIRQRIQADSVAQQDWLADRNFTREFNGALSMMPIRNAYDMSSAIQKYALSEPEVYTPQVISGMTNFFQQNMLSILAQYFPQLVNTGG